MLCNKILWMKMTPNLILTLPGPDLRRKDVLKINFTHVNVYIVTVSTFAIHSYFALATYTLWCIHCEVSISSFSPSPPICLLHNSFKFYGKHDGKVLCSIDVVLNFRPMSSCFLCICKHLRMILFFYL